MNKLYHSMLKTLLFTFILSAFTTAQADDPPTMTHGPMLGQPSDHSMKVWARTSHPTPFSIHYDLSKENLEHTVESPKTEFAHDLTGVAELQDLEADSRYYYQVFIEGSPQGSINSFLTLPSVEGSRNEKYNPKGLFNFRFEAGSCANQNPLHGIGHSLPLYQTMLRELADDINFGIMNGDWLYEELRDTPVETWTAKNRLTEEKTPDIVRNAPSIVGVWENYKLYQSRGVPLAQWHRQVPSVFTFDDHELVNDIWGCGSAGRRHRRTVFRDIGIQAWFDYLGWANPTVSDQSAHFGKAQFIKGSKLLKDSKADFTHLPLDQMANLHVHWGTPNAGVNDIIYDDDSGNPNARVYDIVRVVDKHTLELSHAAVADGEASYSIGRRSYGTFRVSNCQFFLLDTKTYREMHDVKQPDKPGLTMLGKDQREWLLKEMRTSDAEFFFVVSSVPFMIPHSGAGGFEFDALNKEEAWVVFLEEREMLIDTWDEIGKPVFVMTGDLHNSFAIQVTDNVWEFCCGPHNSVNHVPELDEADRPITGHFQSGPRACNIRWSSYVLPDLPRLERLYPYYCVVQVNNVFNMPQKVGGKRLVAYPHPQVIFQYYEGRTGKLAYAEAISLPRKNEE
ncbi:alkaline phosphatase D family protein [Rubinisphaera italica]|uniref:PhoD-like phosphatase n=1 Tax=Rubinisphaera italica TaxID=2527969 RepID=A0A5C5XFA4_9PLAN|nr:metallophosphoesterase family protein [Rubinisphaera italica]TWT61474.1 PhoD-like phosphatase [Rubinisphaera italica]